MYSQPNMVPLSVASWAEVEARTLAAIAGKALGNRTGILGQSSPGAAEPKAALEFAP